jgi:type IV fimbrial biogenesis protein FimT
MYKQQQYNMNTSIHGFTLLELMITVTLVGLLTTIGIPSFTDSLRSNRLTTSANEFISAINLARSEAIKRNQTVSIGSGAALETGWDVFVDLNSNGAFDAGTDEIIRTYPALPAQYTLKSTNNNYIRYRASGESADAASFLICDNRDGNNTPEADTSKLIIIGVVGRPRMGTAAASGITSCPSP